MKKEEWIKQIQDNVPDGAELVLFDHRKNLYDDDGSGSSAGIIRKVEIITHTAQEIEDGCVNVSAIYFDNDDYNEDATACVHDKPKPKQVWKIESVDRFYYHGSRNGLTYKEVTYWYEKHTMERKEVVRQAESPNRDTYSLPDWAKGITEYRKQLNYDF